MRPTEALLEAASRPYAAGSRFDWHFARGKLKRDPVYFALLRMGLIPDRARVLDLGCGQGTLLALLAAAQAQSRPATPTLLAEPRSIAGANHRPGEPTAPGLSALMKSPPQRSGHAPEARPKLRTETKSKPGAETACETGGRAGQRPARAGLRRSPEAPSSLRAAGRTNAGDRSAADGLPTHLWPEGWAPPPAGLRLHGLELRADEVRAAQRALGGRARVEHADLSSAALPRCDVAVLLDVLHYLPPDAQIALLRRAAGALAPGGVLLVREADARGGAAFALTRAAERLMAWARRRPQRFHFRPVDEWRTLLEGLGLDVRSEAMSQGTPFANTLLIARKPLVG